VKRKKTNPPQECSQGYQDFSSGSPFVKNRKPKKEEKNSMKCPFCGSLETQVLDSRDSENLEAIRRRRECLKCHKRFTTYERIESVNLIVIKKDGRREEFAREKLKTGIVKACEKRPISEEEIEEMVDSIEFDLKNYKTTEIPSHKIGELVMKYIKRKDKVAYIRFASVYREFTDVEDFEKELGSLLRKKQT